MRLLKYFIFLHIVLLAQQNDEFSDNIKFKNYSTKDGLSQRSVSAILQDQDDFMWFGTRYGLNKFNGHGFEKYNYDIENENSLSSNWITSLVQDKQGVIWVGTKKGLNKYIKKDNNFIRVKRSNLSKEFYDSEIQDIKTQDDSFLWIATNNGLDKFNKNNNNVLSFRHNDNILNGVSSNQINKILITKNKDLWICTDKKIDLYIPRKNSFQHYDYPNNACPLFTKNNRIALFQDKSGKIWLGYHGGLAYFDEVEQIFKDFKTTSSPNSINSHVRAIYEDGEGNFWIGTYNGLYKLDKDKKGLYRYMNDPMNPKSLAQNSVYEIVEDSRGDLWVGTWAGGVSYYDKRSNDFKNFTEGFTNKQLNYKVVSSIVEGDNQNLWIGTEGGGINIYNRKKETFTYYKSKQNDKNSLSDNNVKAIIKDHKGEFWVGTHGGGLNHIQIKNGRKKIKVFKNVPNNINTISDNNITTLAEDGEYNIWIGTNEGGLNYYNRKEALFFRIKDRRNIIGNFIYDIASYEKENYVWVACENGLAKVDIKTKKISKINYRGDRQNTSLSSPAISICKTSERELWVGTEGEGFYHYNLSTKKSIRYGKIDGLSNEVVYGILPEDENNLWLSTNKGLNKFNIKTKKFSNFQGTDGIQGNEFNYGAYLKTTDRNLIFGGTNGLTIFDPRKIEQDTFTPKISITALKVRNQPYKIEIDLSKPIVLKHNQNDFSFNFVAPNYSQPKKNKYAYKLEGFDENWNYLGNRRSTTYTNLNPGDYIFKIKTSNGGGLWNETPSELKIKIKPPIWRTWYAYVTYVMFVIALYFLIRKYTLLRIRDKNELKQERLDKQQMAEVNKLKLQLFTNISHDFRTPLTLIIGPLKKMIHEKVGDQYIQNQLGGMYRNATVLLQLINQLLDFRKSEAGKLLLRASKNDLVSFVKEIQLSFIELAKERAIDYQMVSKKEHIDVWFDNIEMRKVILNILSNAFKFTPKHGRIQIQISPDETKKEVKIQIKDSGKGIPEENIEYVFDRYFQLGQKNELRSSTGVGLALAKDIIELHKGRIYAENNTDKGSCFTVILPLGASHLLPNQMIEKDNKNNNVDLISSDNFEPNHIKSSYTREEIITNDIEIETSFPTILLVEDNFEVRQFIKSIFKDGFNVFEAQNGIEGLNIAQNQPIDVIISDLMMPEMDGMAMCHEIKSDVKTSHIPVILLTARTSSKVQKQGYETGADVYLTKPFNAETLKLQVDNILKSRQNLVEKYKKDILLEPKEITTVSTDEIFLKKSMEVIEEHLSDADFNVNSFIDKMFMSQSVLYRKIKVLTGQSISEFIRTVRLKKSGQLLLKTDMTVTNIAYDVGFNDIKYFRKCFKVVFEETPSEYRKKNKKS